LKHNHLDTADFNFEGGDNNKSIIQPGLPLKSQLFPGSSNRGGKNAITPETLMQQNIYHEKHTNYRLCNIEEVEEMLEQVKE